jgi:4-hydroxythreonine-4-phosphate dehydrogenase
MQGDPDQDGDPDELPLPLALTIGEPAGVGPELALRVWLERDSEPVPPFVIVGGARLLQRRAERLGWPVPVTASVAEEACGVFDCALPVLPLSMHAEDEPGALTPEGARLAQASIEEAVMLVRTGRAGAVVTNPIHKANLLSTGFSFPGHTEFLAELARSPGGAAPRPVMMLASDGLRTVPITVHVPLRAVPDLLTEALVVETAEIVARELSERFAIARPRLAIASLNPHAGESGHLGHEDDAVLKPAVETLRTRGIDVAGPLSADTMFHPRARAAYDAALCPTHDQALIPIKTIAFDEAVNVTLGLPFVRTSPDHGTALDIAGRGEARPDSLRAALRLAAKLAGAQQHS